MNTYEKEITFKGKDYYLATEFYLDHREDFHFRDFMLTDEDGEEISLEEMRQDEKFYDFIKSLLVDELCVCYAGAPC